jgi:hypothetical protein
MPRRRSPSESFSSSMFEHLLTRPRANFPFFRRWVKITTDEAFFSAAVEASDVLYNFLALRATDVLPCPKFLAGGMQCFRPSAEMLTSVEMAPDESAVDIPPLYDQKPFEAAIRAGHGNFMFSSDNEVLFFGDQPMANGCDASLSKPYL